MKREEFLKAVRQDGAFFRADDISIDTGNEQICGKGTLRVTNGGFLLNVTLDGITNVPRTPTGIISRENFWKVRGVIGNELPFLLEDTPSGTGFHQKGPYLWRDLNFSFRIMDLLPCGLEATTRAELLKSHQQAMVKLQTGAHASGTADLAQVPPSIDEHIRSVDAIFHAIFREYELIAFNGGTTTTVKNAFLGESAPRSKLDTFHGEFEHWKFALIQDGSDLEVHFRSKPNYNSPSEDEDQRLFHSFLNAVAFTHGQHGWPFVIEYSRDGKSVLDRVHLTRDIAQIPHAPFTKGMDRNARAGRSKWEFIDPLEKAYRFFSTKTKLASEITNLLYLFREASAPRVPKRITLLSLCGLFESLVHVIYDAQLASTKPLPPTRPLRATEFESVVKHLHIKLDQRWSQIFKLWYDFRNPLSHRLSDADYSDASTKEQLLAESKIAGAVNCIILKLMGYSGPVHASAYEQECIII